MEVLTDVQLDQLSPPLLVDPMSFAEALFAGVTSFEALLELAGLVEDLGAVTDVLA